MNKHRLLEIAEYISIFTVVAGSTIAIASGQIIYATVPIALAILLNLVRRYQFEKQLHQRVNRNDNEIYQQILNDIQSLTRLAISSQNNYEAIQHDITALSEKLDSVKTDMQGNLNDENIYRLQTQCQDLQETLNSLIYRMLSCGVLSSGDTKPAEKGIANIVSQYQNYKQEYNNSYSAMLPEDLESDDL
jgi:ABC-type transport system involved in cytochrome bd biosynthesis fused ATPase/permease subunit